MPDIAPAGRGGELSCCCRLIASREDEEGQVRTVCEFSGQAHQSKYEGAWEVNGGAATPPVSRFEAAHDERPSRRSGSSALAAPYILIV